MRSPHLAVGTVGCVWRGLLASEGDPGDALMASSSERSAAAVGLEGDADRDLESTPSMSASERLQRARQVHEALRHATRRVQGHQPPLDTSDTTPPPSPQVPTSASVADLASQLEELYQRTKSVSGEGNSASPRLRASLARIGAEEKDELLLHLLQMCDALRSQRDEASALGEGIAAQLVRQQHELRLKCRQRVDELERDLRRAVHAHPEVAALRAQVRQLSDANRDLDKHLRFSVVKLQRSRDRERELKRLHDPLWDI